MIPRSGNILYFSSPVVIETIPGIAAALHHAVKAGYPELTLDFTDCTAALPAPMLALCSRVVRLRQEDINCKLIMPKKHSLANHFVNANWAHLLDPESFSQSKFRGHTIFPATHFEDSVGQRNAVDRVVSAVLGSTIGIDRHGLSSFEWSIAEITDNVLLHSQSSIGGLVQLSMYKKVSQRLEFIVVDSGVGIPSTLRQSKLKITSDTEAIDMSVKEGVTRDRDLGQGNGLFGTYQVCKKSQGRFFLQSGHARLVSGPSPGHTVEFQTVPYEGTIIAAQINFSDPRLLANALQFGGKVHIPMDFVETHYEDWESDEVHFTLSQETSSFRSRPGGVPIRNKLLNLLEMCPRQKIVVDFKDIPLISSSFADEVFAKLYLEIGDQGFSSRIEFKDVTPLVRLLINRAITQRLNLRESNSSQTESQS